MICIDCKRDKGSVPREGEPCMACWMKAGGPFMDEGRTDPEYVRCLEKVHQIALEFAHNHDDGEGPCLRCAADKVSQFHRLSNAFIRFNKGARLGNH